MSENGEEKNKISKGFVRDVDGRKFRGIGTSEGGEEGGEA